MTVKSCIKEQVQEYLTKLMGESKDNNDLYSKIKIDDAYKYTFQKDTNQKTSCGVLIFPYALKKQF